MAPTPPSPETDAPPPDLPSVLVAHVSDTHLGYEAYAARSPSGHNQRGEDVVRAFHNAVDDIIAADPPLVVHSGDVAERPQVPIRYMLAIRAELARLASLRPDGTRRQLVVIAGNHDASRHLKEGCFLELYRGLPGCHIVTRGYREIDFDPDRDACAPELAHVRVHALPHDSLRHEDEIASATPREGFLNVLVTHGVAEGSELFVRAVGREYPIPADLLLRRWEYAALGHWHVSGPVPLAGSTTNSRAWYAGATEHIDFSDLRAPAASSRAWLLVTLEAAQPPTVRTQSIPVRPMMSLPTIDGSLLTPEAISAELVKNIEGTDLTGAVVRQKVNGLARDLWALADLVPARSAASAALHFRIDPFFAKAPTDQADTAAPGVSLGDVGRLLTERAEALVPLEDRPATLAAARLLLTAVLDETAGGDGTTDAAPDPDADPKPDAAAQVTNPEVTNSEVTNSEVPSSESADPLPSPGEQPQDLTAVFAAVTAELSMRTLESTDQAASGPHAATDAEPVEGQEVAS